MENQQTDLQMVGENFRTLQTKRANAQIELRNLEMELQQTEFRKAIQEKKMEVAELEKKESEMKANIMNWMLQNQLKSIEFTFQKFTVKKNPWSLVIEDESKIPDEFKKEKVEIVIDKKAIKDKITNGENVDGASVTYSHSLVITPK